MACGLIFTAAEISNEAVMKRGEKKKNLDGLLLNSLISGRAQRATLPKQEFESLKKKILIHSFFFFLDRV